MTKKKEICQYELLCLWNKKHKSWINGLENFLGRENIQHLKEEDWKPVYKVNHSLNEVGYLNINFNSAREKIPFFQKNFLQPLTNDFFFRYNLTQLTRAKKEIKLKKNVKQY